jgi:hypothetical protein
MTQAQDNYPRNLITIKLPDEPLTARRYYCLRQISPSEWSTCYYAPHVREGDKGYKTIPQEGGKKTGSFYHGHYFSSLEAASECFNEEINRQTERYNYFVGKFFSHRSLLATLDTDEVK